MPHQYGLPGFAQTSPSPPSQQNALLPRVSGPASTGSGSINSNNSNSMFRLQEDNRLTREAMERYMRDRNDKVIVILHAKVRIENKTNNNFGSSFFKLSYLKLLYLK